MKIIDAKTFGEAIRKKRKEQGLTQKTVSDMTGISCSFISDVENGKETVELGKAVFLANILGLDIEIISR